MGIDNTKYFFNYKIIMEYLLKKMFKTWLSLMEYKIKGYRYTKEKQHEWV